MNASIDVSAGDGERNSYQSLSLLPIMLSPRNRNAEWMSFECVGSTRNREVLAWAAIKSCGCAGSRRISQTWYTQTDSTYKLKI